MEMRACEDVDDIGEDLTPPILPIAFSLSDPFLHSHCSSCFRPLNPQFPPLLPNKPINSHPIPLEPNSHHTLLYCSPACSDADSDRHFSSAEYHLFLILRSESTTWHGDTSDLRTALRLLLCFQKLGLLSRQYERIGGLISNREKLENEEEYDEILARIREGGRLMSLARRMRDGDFKVGGERSENNVVEETVLCQVLTNAVEVQINEQRTLGIAVYGPSFSWINHSCSPNACYRFSLVGSETQDSGESRLRIIASGEEAILKTWVCDERKLNNGLCVYGPRIIVRSIKPIKKGEEVCVAYTDLLQPKAMRHSELWFRYRFICCCRRCSTLPLAYVDRVLQENATANLKATNSSLDHNFYRDEPYKELTDCLDETISEYLSVGNPETLCEKLENMLIQSLQEEQLQPEEEPSWPNFKLLPLHHLSLNAFITLASAYKIRASNLLALNSEMDYHRLEAFKLSRTSAAYSLLLAGATHNLFLSESSLIAHTANFWISAGESLLSLARSLIWNSILYRELPDLSLSSLPSHKHGKCLLMDKLEVDLSCNQSRCISTQSEFKEISKGFLDCVSRISPKVWPFLIHTQRYFKDIKDPVDFSWLGTTKNPNIGKSRTPPGSTDVGSYYVNGGSCSCRCEADEHTDKERTSIFQLGAHCVLYGGYLASICYCRHGYLTGYVRNLLWGGDIQRYP